MDRIREGRRATNMAAPPNGILSSRRRHRSNSLRDSPDEEGGVEVQEQGRLRERGVVKKERGERDRERERERDRERERERERERSSRSKRRRENRMMSHHVNTGSNRDEGDETTSDSGNEEEEDEDTGVGLRMLHTSPSVNPSVSASNHHSHNNNINNINIHHRKSFPPVNNKVVRTATASPAPAPAPSWKATDEMIGVSVPRKARSASTKRSHEWISGVVGVGATADRQSSASPVRLASSAASHAPAAPPSPSSSNVSVRKKMKANGGGSKPRPPKSSSKSSSSNPEELEIEIAEVLYGLMTQSQAPSKKEIDSNNKSSSDTKSRVSSPISNSIAVPQNSTSLTTVAPKRKRPRQVTENPVSSSIKTEIDHHNQQRHQSPKTDISSPYMENNSSASAVAAADNGVSSFGLTTFPGHKAVNSATSSELPVVVPEEEKKCGVGAVLTKEEAEKESHLVKLNDGNSKIEAVITTAASTTVTNLKLANPETQSQKDEKFEIDLMAPPPQQRTLHGNDGDIEFSDHKQIATQETSKTKEGDKLRKSDTDEQKVGTIQETGESSKHAVNEVNIQLKLDLEKPDKGSASMVSGNSNRSLHQALKHPHLSAKSETHTEKNAQSSSIPMPMSVPNWPPMGYVAPLQGVISMDGNPMASAAPIQPIFTNPRPKRCATHCYIARNIHCYQQFMKINPFWPGASGSAAPMFGAKPCNLNVMPSTELHANIPQSMQDKGQAVGIFPGYTTGKDAKSSQPMTVNDPAQRKQQVLLQQAMPPVAPNNILHGPAFIFPFNQQQAVAASASVRPGSSKLTASTAPGSLGAASGPANSATVSSSTTAGAPALSFNYPNMGTSETQYLAILQNNPYSFPMPGVGAPPNYRPGSHAQAMPLFNGSFYSSQMIHPSQIPQQTQQATPPTQAQNHHPSQSQQTHQNSSGSTSSSQKHLQAQQRQQGSAAAAVTGGGSGNVGSLHNSYQAAAHKSRSQQSSQQQNPHVNPALQARHLENEVTGREGSPSTADSRVSRPANTMSVYSHNFAMPGHSKAFPQMDNPNGALNKSAAGATVSTNSNDKHQQQQQSQQQALKRGGTDSSLSPQTFAMSFSPMNGTSGSISSMAQNHAIFQSLPESLRQGYHMMAAPTAAAHQSQQKEFRVSEETTRTGHDSSNADEDRKVSSGLTAKSGQSIAFSRPDLSTDASGTNNRSSRSPLSTSVGTASQSSHPLHVQYQQQQHILQLQKQQQQNPNMNNARSKNPPSSNGSPYPEQFMTSSPSMAAKFPNSIPSFPLQTSNTSSSPVQSPQWRNSVRGPTTSQVPSSLASATTTSSLKNLHQSQQQSSRSHTQSHTQISFGTAASQKLQSTTPVQMQQQQVPNSNSGNQSASPPMLVGSPTTSISKGSGGGGSPRTNVSASTSGRTGQVSSLSSSQQAKNSPVGTQRSSPSILGNPNNLNSTKPQQQQQQQKQTLHQQKVQAMMMYGQPYMQVQQQAQQHAGSSMPPAQMMMYSHPIRLQQQQSSQQQLSQQQPPSSSAMLSLSPPVTHANTATSDPAKAIAAATSMMNHPQYGSAAAQSMPAGFPQYAHNSPAAAAVQVKPAEQKQPAGNDNLRMSQPEKK